MAVHTYRFRLETPGVSEEQLEAEVGVSVLISDYAGGIVIDVDCDDSRASDLMDSMAFRGYEFVEGDPPTTDACQFREDIDVFCKSEHKTVLDLIHFVDNGPADGFATGAHREITGTAFPTAIIWYDKVGAGRKKIVEKLITWTGVNPTTVAWKIYDTSEVLLATVTDTISYSGVFETSRTRAVS